MTFSQQPSLADLLGVAKDNITSTLGSLVSNFKNNKSGDIKEQRDLGFGRRTDETQKGLGFFGKIPLPKDQKGFATELAFTTEIDGKEALIPLIVPGLNKEQINRLLTSEGLEGIEDILDLAEEFASKRAKEGKPFFASEEEEGKTLFPNQ